MSVSHDDTMPVADTEKPVEETTETQALFLRYWQTRDAQLRDLLVHQHMNLVNFLARKYANRGESVEDLVSVGTIGLLNAIDRFDPTRGFQFSTYAIPTILGEIKREFRDRGWAIRVPRKLQEVHLAAAKAVEELSITLQRSPTIPEVAEKIGASVEDTLAGMEVGSFYSLVSLEGGMNSDDNEGGELLDLVGDTDVHFEDFALGSQLEQALSQLPKRERTIIMLRFFRGWTQSQIAQVLHISQMHVSRQQAKAQEMLRNILRENDRAAE